MTALPRASRRRPLWALAALLIALLAFRPATAGEMMSAEGIPPDAAQSSVLDGKVFVGEFGRTGEEAQGSDRWVFENGMFLSESCKECGFPATPYWVGFAKGDGTTFVAESRCPVTDAKLKWRGTVKDGEVRGVWTWTKERWYWTVQKEYWFKGTLSDVPPEETAALK